MAATYAILEVFVACPDDIVEERDAVRRVADEINRTLARQQGIRLEVVDWQKDGYPGLGADAQDVLNQEIGDRCDIFIGILWTRFGTPTNRAESGTEEEFDRVLARYNANPRQVRVMLYFSERQTNPRMLDSEQLKRIDAFRQRVSPLGLYWTYADTSDFESSVRVHLIKQVQEWGKSWGPFGPPAPSGPPSPRAPEVAVAGQPASGPPRREKRPKPGVSRRP